VLGHRQLSSLHSFTERRQITLLVYSHAFSQIHQFNCQEAASDISINQTDRMSETGAAGYAPLKTPVLNTERNKPLHELSYKELQNMCMGFNLPANLKVSGGFLCKCSLLAMSRLLTRIHKFVFMPSNLIQPNSKINSGT
jgi:hypothetical protein